MSESNPERPPLSAAAFLALPKEVRELVGSFVWGDNSDDKKCFTLHVPQTKSMSLDVVHEPGMAFKVLEDQ